MKQTILSLAAMLVLSCNLFSQNTPVCNANVEALEEQVRILAEMLGDETIVNEVNAIQKERAETRFTLSEKDPNPYEVEKEITLTVPESAKEVEVVFINSLGQQIKAMDLQERGETSIKVYMSNYLKDGFNYHLVIDGTLMKS